MFYCDKCQVKHDLPDLGGLKSYGPCELCGNMTGCHDVPCSLIEKLEQEQAKKKSKADE